MGEPFLSGFDPQELAGELATAGMQLREDIDDNVLSQQYDPEGRGSVDRPGDLEKASETWRDADRAMQAGGFWFGLLVDCDNRDSRHEHLALAHQHRTSASLRRGLLTDRARSAPLRGKL